MNDATDAASVHPLPPLSLYLHFPWCVRKCPYCDFNSHTLKGELPESSYIEALLADLASEAPRAAGRDIQSVFLGGGTPSLFSPHSLGRLLEGARREIAFVPDVEVTLEANPATVERGRFADYRAAGITRVSLGAQSFADEQLRALGRIHCAAETQRAAEELHASGLANFNLDLMYGLPQQSVRQALADVESSLGLMPAHISHYQLTLEPGTVFGARPPSGLPDQDRCGEMQDACQERLAQAGFGQYEVSAYARAHARCRHNLNYWRFGDYLGVGAGAHGKCTRIERGELTIERSVRPREPRRYLASRRASVAPDSRAIGDERRIVPPGDRPFEYMMNALRLNEGFGKDEFEGRTGLPFEVIVEALAWGLGAGLLEQTGDRWHASTRGFDLLNELIAQFLPRR